MGDLVIIDSFAVLHRAYHSIPPLTDVHGQATNALYGYLSTLIKVINDLNPKYLAACFDTEKPTFRKKIFPLYQSRRPKTEDNLKLQFKKAREMVSLFKIPVFVKPGYEADDLIGTIAHFGEESKEVKNTYIVTGDRDLMQLVTPKTSLYLLVRGLSQTGIYSTDQVIEKMGVKPTQIVDYKALVGDPSDNYPGVKGLGPKTVIALLNRFDSLEAIYNNLDELPVATKGKLLKGKKLGQVSRKLAQIETKVPVKMDLKAMSEWKMQEPEGIKYLERLGFKSIIGRLNRLEMLPLEMSKDTQEKKELPREQGSLF